MSDKTSVYCNNPQTKQQSSQQNSPSSPQPKKVRLAIWNIKRFFSQKTRGNCSTGICFSRPNQYPALLLGVFF